MVLLSAFKTCIYILIYLILNTSASGPDSYSDDEAVVLAVVKLAAQHPDILYDVMARQHPVIGTKREELLEKISNIKSSHRDQETCDTCIVRKCIFLYFVPSR